MLLMIDNYDSFTYTLVQYFQALGQEVAVLRNDEVTLSQLAKPEARAYCHFTRPLHTE
jgi:anthranilate/para-aminobenzoate synthase component II